mgnify:CR=1 FL=1
MAWAEDYRQNWIAETIRVFGFINRTHLMRKFGISSQQASHDLGVFQTLRPGVMAYDKNAKRYVRCETDPRPAAPGIQGDEYGQST